MDRINGQRGVARAEFASWWHAGRALWSGLDDAAGAMRARHLSAMLRVAPLTMGATALSVVLTAWMLQTTISSLALVLWSGSLLALCVHGFQGWWKRRNLHPETAGPVAIRRATAHAAVMGLGWAAASGAWLPVLDPTQQVWMVVVLMALMCGGTVALSLIPSAALSFLAIITSGLWVGLARSELQLVAPLIGLVGAYAVVMAALVVSAAHFYARGVLTEREASRQGEVFGLLLRDFEESSADVLWEVDRFGRFVNPSRRLAGWAERPADRLTQLTLMQLMKSLQPEGSSGVERLQQALDRGEAFREVPVRVQVASGQRWWAVTGKPLTDEQGVPCGWRGVLSDVTAARQSHQHVAYLAQHDALTGLANRTTIRNRVAQSLEAGGRRGALLCMDLDNFKLINDTHGHTLGDKVLQEVARRLRVHVRKGDVCGRLGGDEFAVVIADARSDDEVQAFAQRLVVSMRVPIEIEQASVTTGVSIGLAFLPDHAQTVDEAMVAADLALYSAKSSGRGRVEAFTSELGEIQRRRATLERELRQALARDELEVYYQPQVDLKTWTICGAEALVRWHHPDLGSISPAEFVPVAEATGLIHNIGAWVLAKASSDAKQLLPGLRIAVNASAAQVQRASFVNEVRQLLQRQELAVGQLEIEITESLLMEDVQTALENLHAIKQLGVRIALDDFGTGYSSLAYLRRFPFDKLKIDRAFIRELTSTSDARAIVRTILQLARVLGMDTVAEGVEEPAQLEVLQHVGCGSIQGFLVARPMPVQSLIQLRESWAKLPRPLFEGALPESVLAELPPAESR
ncbi:putative bifunctional diguanylate cyclase/phosphodiesterase [Inhella gelatinilytica]|uniref:EAL domain-containing protein n=1 Tax=Inhella gelatinilytica TaxID=2795030 RepID=A0A931NF02_9BURK|nr:EAL domain-containing protein [Inhella gelatinilytica]MBH9553760.1 EAL domain-containing protein [Inhella gelatinilytica]